MNRIHQNAMAFCMATFVLLAAVANGQQEVQQPVSVLPVALVKMVPIQEEAIIPMQDEAVAPAGCTDCSRTAAGGACGSCNSSEAVCFPRRTKEKVKKHGWNVLCENVCVPAFKWPWESCCKPKCGYVRGIHVLEKHEYECEKCGYEWTIKCVRSSCNGRSGQGGAFCPDCGASSPGCDQ